MAAPTFEIYRDPEGERLWHWRLVGASNVVLAVSDEVGVERRSTIIRRIEQLKSTIVGAGIIERVPVRAATPELPLKPEDSE